MGYLDKQSRVIDVTLTERGRKLYAIGQLDFSYFGLFDDGIDYDPIKASGSFSDDERRDQIEATLVLEPPFIRDVRGHVAPLEPTAHIFTAAPGYRVLPALMTPTDNDSITLMADQRRSEGTYRRTGTSLAQIDMGVTGEVERGNPGFIVRVLSSGSNGFRELGFRRDLEARRAVDPFIAVAVDGEAVVDRILIRDPDGLRVSNRSNPRKR